MKPTNQQAIELFKVCQDLTQMYLPIYLVRLDEHKDCTSKRLLKIV
ncbi:DUF6888 family protein [Nostoc sp.]